MTWQDDDKRYQEPVSWWDMLTPHGQFVAAVAVLFVFALIMIGVSTLETWGT